MSGEKKMKPAVGVVGLGAMGGAMARVLLRAGFAVAGADPQPAARRRLTEAGGTAFAAAAELQLQAHDALIVMTVDADQAEAALFDAADGKLQAAVAGTLVLLTLTMPPARAKHLCGRLAAAGCCPLDAPVTGGAAGAAAGTLVFMTGGPAATVARARPLTDALGKKVCGFGEEFGLGSAAKLVNQLAAGCNLAAAAEAMALGTRLGLPPEALFELLRSGAGQSWMADDRIPRMLSGAFTPPKSAVDIFVKDLGIVLEGGRRRGEDLPMAKTARALFAAAAAAGLGREDDSALVKLRPPPAAPAGE